MTFSEEEKDQLRKFTNRSYLLDRKSRLHAWLGLLDIVLAYAYDVRTTEGEHCVSPGSGKGGRWAVGTVLLLLVSC